MACHMTAARLPFLSCLALLCALALQGCNVAVPRHPVGNWESKPSYLTEYQYVFPATALTSAKAILNSCNDPAITANMQCSGHGVCRPWNDVPSAPPGVQAPVPVQKPLSFCECDRDYADPECRTPRKSQMTAYVLTMFAGIFGAEEFYLGYNWTGVFKLLLYLSVFYGIYQSSRTSWSFVDERATAGRIVLLDTGIVLAVTLYLYDLCRIGSAPVYTARNFQVAPDLSHFGFVLSVVSFMGFLGFFYAIKTIHDTRKRKAHELLLLRFDKEQEGLPELPSHILKPSNKAHSHHHHHHHGHDHHHHGHHHHHDKEPREELPYTGYGSMIGSQPRILPPAGGSATMAMPATGPVPMPTPSAIVTGPVAMPSFGPALVPGLVPGIPAVSVGPVAFPSGATMTSGPVAMPTPTTITSPRSGPIAMPTPASMGEIATGTRPPVGMGPAPFPSMGNAPPPTVPPGGLPSSSWTNRPPSPTLPQARGLSSPLGSRRAADSPIDNVAEDMGSQYLTTIG